ncbi:MAG: hypothetical protein ACKORF_02965 [Micrococcales bacterium]
MTSPLLPNIQDSVWAIFVLGLIGFLVLLALAFYFVNAWLLSTFYEKVGVQKWKAWIPVYQLWPFFEVAGFAGGWSLLALASVAPVPFFLASALINAPAWQMGGGLNFLERFDWQYLDGGLAVFGVLLAVSAQLAPVALTVLGAISAFRIGRAFDKDPALCAVAFVLLPPVFFGMLGLGSAKANQEKLATIARK